MEIMTRVLGIVMILFLFRSIGMLVSKDEERVIFEMGVLSFVIILFILIALASMVIDISALFGYVANPILNKASGYETLEAIAYLHFFSYMVHKLFDEEKYRILFRKNDRYNKEE